MSKACDCVKVDCDGSVHGVEGRPRPPSSKRCKQQQQQTQRLISKSTWYCTVRILLCSRKRFYTPAGSDSTCGRMSYPGARTWVVIGFLTLVGTHSLGCSLSGEEAEALFSRAVIVV